MGGSREAAAAITSSIFAFHEPMKCSREFLKKLSTLFSRSPPSALDLFFGVPPPAAGLGATGSTLCPGSFLIRSKTYLAKGRSLPARMDSTTQFGWTTGTGFFSFWCCFSFASVRLAQITCVTLALEK